MRKIANTTELTGELERILDYAGSYQPSRVKLAAELTGLSQRLALGSYGETPPRWRTAQVLPAPDKEVRAIMANLNTLLSKLGGHGVQEAEYHESKYSWGVEITVDGLFRSHELPDERDDAKRDGEGELVGHDRYNRDDQLKALRTSWKQTIEPAMKRHKRVSEVQVSIADEAKKWVRVSVHITKGAGDEVKSIIAKLNDLLSDLGEPGGDAKYDERYKYVGGEFRAPGLPYGGDRGYTESKRRQAEERLIRETASHVQRSLSGFTSVKSVNVTVGDKDWVNVQVNLK